MNDQASTLREWVKRNRPQPTGNCPCEVIAVTSGKGGVGKSNISMNLAISLAQKGHKVLVLDADIGTANIDILLNLDTRLHLGHLADGQASLFQVIEKVAENLYLIPGASGVPDISQLPFHKWEQLREDLAKVESMFQYLIVDTSAGVHGRVINLLRGADRILLICNNEPTSIVDAYALCKVFYKDVPEARLELIANNVSGPADAEEVYGKLRVAIKHFLSKELHYLDHVIHDEAIALGVINQKPLMMSSVTTGAAVNFLAISEKLAHPGGWAAGKGIYHLFHLLFDE